MTVQEVAKKLDVSTQYATRILYLLKKMGRVEGEDGNAWRALQPPRTASKRGISIEIMTPPVVPGDAEAERIRQSSVLLFFSGIPTPKEAENAARFLNEALSETEARLVEGYPGIIIPRGKDVRYLSDKLTRFGFQAPSIEPDWTVTPPSPAPAPLVPVVDRSSANLKSGEDIQTPSEARLDELSEFFALDLKKYEKFRGNYIYEWGWLMYLQDLLSREGRVAICTWMANQGETGILFARDQLTVEDSTVLAISHCLREGARFVFGIMVLRLQRGYHANALIFDSKGKTLARFEPHGTGSYSHAPLDDALRVWLRNTFGREWTYIPATDICPVPGPQTRDAADFLGKTYKKIKVFGKERKAETKGFCAAWALLYIHMRLANPDKTEKQIVDAMLRWSDAETAEKVRRYAEYIVATVDKKKVKQQTGDLRVGDAVYITYGTNKKAQGIIKSYERGKAVMHGVTIVGGKVKEKALFTTGNPAMRYGRLTDQEAAEVRKELAKVQYSTGKMGEVVRTSFLKPKKRIVGVIDSLMINGKPVVKGNVVVKGWTISGNKAPQRFRATMSVSALEILPSTSIDYKLATT